MPVRYRALCTKQRFLSADTKPRGCSARIGGEVMVPTWALANMQPENACCEVACGNTSVSRSKRVACGTSNADRPGTLVNRPGRLRLTGGPT